MYRPNQEIPEVKHSYEFPLDPFQLHAMSSIVKGENVMVCAKTGSGKTLIGEYQIEVSLSKQKRVFYTTPIKSLSNQKYEELRKRFPDASVGLMTGDIKYRPDAQIVIMTTEILRNLLYKKGTSTESLGLTASMTIDGLDAVIFDECHYMNDPNRGKIWEETLILLPKEIHLVLLSATMDHPETVAEWLYELKRKKIQLIETTHRVVPLTHYLIRGEQLVPLMDSADKYHEIVYAQWLQVRKAEQNEYRKQQEQFKNKNKDKDKEKVRQPHFVHVLNGTVELLNKKELLPAISFVFSKKQCEHYAKQIQHTLLTTTETAEVKHIISFHLHQYHLEQNEQYQQLYPLLCRGLAFHHSGIIPLLKEMVEILFSKGFVRLLFCTETFSVGLNMPTKTVIFTGYKKHDTELGRHRILRKDEYIQMAGRAGRRGKDKIGTVIYVPDHEPLSLSEMYEMMKGPYLKMTSRMEFNEEFVLKTLQSSTEPEKSLQVQRDSYWTYQQKRELNKLQRKQQVLMKQKQSIQIDPVYEQGCQDRWTYEEKKKISPSKDIQRQLDSLKNKQLGPRWNTALSDYQKKMDIQKELESVVQEMVECEKDLLSTVIHTLFTKGFITHSDLSTLTSKDLTLKGVLATEINEANPLIMSELFISKKFHSLSAEQIVIYLSCFLESNQDSPVSLIDTFGIWDDSMTTEWMPVIEKWIHGEELSTICAEFDIFEGNLIRILLKLKNIIEEWINMAIYCQHVEQIKKMMEITQWNLETHSLYLK